MDKIQKGKQSDGLMKFKIAEKVKENGRLREPFRSPTNRLWQGGQLACVPKSPASRDTSMCRHEHKDGHGKGYGYEARFV